MRTGGLLFILTCTSSPCFVYASFIHAYMYMYVAAKSLHWLENTNPVMARLAGVLFQTSTLVCMAKGLF